MSAIQIEHTTTSRQSFAAGFARERVELAERESDFVSVKLYWTRDTDVVAVAVEDAKTGDFFEIVVAENERALDVFQHPFAYARARGIGLLGDTRGVAVGVDAQP